MRERALSSKFYALVKFEIRIITLQWVLTDKIILYYSFLGVINLILSVLLFDHVLVVKNHKVKEVNIMTKVLGVMPSSKDVVWSLVEGDDQNANTVPLETDRQSMNQQKSEAERLKEFKDTFSEHLKDSQPDKVVIAGAGKSAYGNNSPDRTKYEAAIQIACVEAGIDVEVSKMKLKNGLKKFEDSNGDLEDAINGGNKFVSNARKQAAFIAKENL